jgi:hypothetical protein
VRPTARGRAAVTQRLRGPRRVATLDPMRPEERLASRGIAPERVAAHLAASRARQGLPPTVEDPEALARMAALVARRAGPLSRP